MVAIIIHLLIITIDFTTSYKNISLIFFKSHKNAVTIYSKKLFLRLWVIEIVLSCRQAYIELKN